MDDKQILVAARLKSHRINWYRRHEPLSDKILSGHELALRADISPSHLSTLEHGKKSPREDTLTKLAAALNIEMAKLYDRHGQHQRHLERLGASPQEVTIG